MHLFIYFNMCYLASVTVLGTSNYRRDKLKFCQLSKLKLNFSVANEILPIQMGNVTGVLKKRRIEKETCARIAAHRQGH